MKLSPWEPDLRTIVDRIDSGDIDLQPDFQRQEVWTPAKKKRLVDTILRWWSIPPVFLVVRADGRMDVLDGQQRLAAVRDFMHNDFTIDGAITPPDSRIESFHGLSYRRLNSTEKRLFDQYTLRCFKITDYSPDEPSELFYRLNQPSILTAGEQRNAFYGPAREQLKELVEDFEQGGNDKKSIGFSNVRLAYDDIIARLLFFIEAKSFAIKGTEAIISQRFRTKDKFPNAVADRARNSIRLFSQARGRTSGVRLNKASVLSWLLFYSRFKAKTLDDEFFEFFLQSAKASSPRNYIGDAFNVFQDRASLRVTDVSSVAYRDFCLWYSYYYFGPANLPDSVSVDFIKYVRGVIGRRNDATFEDVLNRAINPSEWGTLP